MAVKTDNNYKKKKKKKKREDLWKDKNQDYD